MLSWLFHDCHTSSWMEPYSRRRLLGVTDHVDQTVKHGERTEQHSALSNTERDLEEVTGPKRAKLHFWAPCMSNSCICDEDLLQPCCTLYCTVFCTRDRKGQSHWHFVVAIRSISQGLIMNDADSWWFKQRLCQFCHSPGICPRGDSRKSRQSRKTRSRKIRQSRKTR